MEGRFNGGFFALQFWGAYIWTDLYKEGLIFGILRYVTVSRPCCLLEFYPNTGPHSGEKLNNKHQLWLNCVSTKSVGYFVLLTSDCTAVGQVVLWMPLEGTHWPHEKYYVPMAEIQQIVV